MLASSSARPRSWKCVTCHMGNEHFEIRRRLLHGRLSSYTSRQSDSTATLKRPMNHQITFGSIRSKTNRQMRSSNRLFHLLGWACAQRAIQGTVAAAPHKVWDQPDSWQLYLGAVQEVSQGTIRATATRAHCITRPEHGDEALTSIECDALIARCSWSFKSATCQPRIRREIIP